MIEKQLLITGSPRSGTSMFQKVLRDHPSFWSLPSESELVWHLYCHPKLNDWKSEAAGPEKATPEAIETIRRSLELHTAPSGVWRLIERTNFIWSNKRWGFGRAILRNVYLALYPRLRSLITSGKKIYYLDKTSSNTLRLGFVNRVFPESKIIYVTRHGYANVNSLINAWRNPRRFFSYDVPVELHIEGYDFKPWCLVLPPGWEEYVNRPLEEVCVFQWRACHETMLAEIAKPEFLGRVLQVKLEDMISRTKETLKRITEFVEVPWGDYFEDLARNLPIVNSPDDDQDQNKWKRQNPEEIERVRHLIDPMNRRLGYDN